MKSVEDLGPLNDESRRGFFIHGHYVVSEQGLPLGLIGADTITRDDEHFRRAAHRKSRPVDDKESHRWIEGYRKACELALIPGVSAINGSRTPDRIAPVDRKPSALRLESTCKSLPASNFRITV